MCSHGKLRQLSAQVDTFAMHQNADVIQLASRDNTRPSRKLFLKTGLLVLTSYEICLFPVILQLCLALKTRACTTDPLRDAPQPWALSVPASLEFPSGQSWLEGSGLVS